MALHVKRGDTVQIIAGDHKGATGRVLHVYPEKQVVVVQGQNVAKRHVRPSRRNPLVTNRSQIMSHISLQVAVE